MHSMRWIVSQERPQILYGIGATEPEATVEESLCV